MKEFRVKWCRCPTNHNSSKILFIEAANADDAKAIARDHIERVFAEGWFTIEVVDEAKKSLPAGRVLPRCWPTSHEHE